MIVLNDGMPTSQQFMTHLISGGKVPEFLMDVPIDKFTCDHEHMIPYYSDGIWLGKCRCCDREIVFDPDILEEFDLFDNKLLAQLVIEVSREPFKEHGYEKIKNRNL